MALTQPTSTATTPASLSRITNLTNGKAPPIFFVSQHPASNEEIVSETYIGGGMETSTTHLQTMKVLNSLPTVRLMLQFPPTKPLPLLEGDPKMRTLGRHLTRGSMKTDGGVSISIMKSPFLLPDQSTTRLKHIQCTPF